MIARSTARDWRADGYRVMFRDGRVYLFIAGATGAADPCWTILVNGGRWMQQPDLGAWLRIPFGKLVPALAADLRRADATCYCSSLSGTGCDFCQGVRRAA